MASFVNAEGMLSIWLRESIVNSRPYPALYIFASPLLGTLDYWSAEFFDDTQRVLQGPFKRFTLSLDMKTSYGGVSPLKWPLHHNSVQVCTCQITKEGVHWNRCYAVQFCQYNETGALVQKNSITRSTRNILVWSLVPLRCFSHSKWQVVYTYRPMAPFFLFFFFFSRFALNPEYKMRSSCSDI